MGEGEGEGTGAGKAPVREVERVRVREQVRAQEPGKEQAPEQGVEWERELVSDSVLMWKPKLNYYFDAQIRSLASRNC